MLTPNFDFTGHPPLSSWRQAPGQSQPARDKQKGQCDVNGTNLATALSFRGFSDGNSLKSGSLKDCQQKASQNILGHTKSRPRSSGLRVPIFFFLAFMMLGKEAYRGSAGTLSATGLHQII